MLGFQTDRSVDVRKFVVTFIEEARYWYSVKYLQF